jgi:hypothetical protein
MTMSSHTGVIWSIDVHDVHCSSDGCSGTTVEDHVIMM